MNAFIIDDLEVSRDTLKQMLSIYCPKIKVIGEADNYTDAIIEIQKNEVDLLFLDIDLGSSQTGFHILDKLKKFQGSIIIVTAHDHYALNAFKYDVCHYLVKPIDPVELLESVNRVLTQMKGRMQAPVLKFINPKHQITLPIRSGVVIVIIDEVVYMEGSGSYTIIYFYNKPEIKISKNLKLVSEYFSQYSQLIRVQKSYVINAKYITKYLKSEGGIIELFGKYRIPISSIYKDNLFKLLERLKKG